MFLFRLTVVVSRKKDDDDDDDDGVPKASQDKIPSLSFGV